MSTIWILSPVLTHLFSCILLKIDNYTWDTSTYGTYFEENDNLHQVYRKRTIILLNSYNLLIFFFFIFFLKCTIYNSLSLGYQWTVVTILARFPCDSVYRFILKFLYENWLQKSEILDQIGLICFTLQKVNNSRIWIHVLVLKKIEIMVRIGFI